jgi:hypothetical protein
VITVPADVDRLMGAVLLSPDDELARLALADAAEEIGLYDDRSRAVLRLPGGWWRAYHVPVGAASTFAPLVPPHKAHLVRYVAPVTPEDYPRYAPYVHGRPDDYNPCRNYRLAPEPRPAGAAAVMTCALFRTSVKCHLHAAKAALNRQRSPSRPHYWQDDEPPSVVCHTPFTRGRWVCEACYAKDCREVAKGRTSLYYLAGATP